MKPKTFSKSHLLRALYIDSMYAQLKGHSQIIDKDRSLKEQVKRSNSSWFVLKAPRKIAAL